jgi:hypothetical protein
MLETHPLIPMRSAAVTGCLPYDRAGASGIRNLPSSIDDRRS